MWLCRSLSLRLLLYHRKSVMKMLIVQIQLFGGKTCRIKGEEQEAAKKQLI